MPGDHDYKKKKKEIKERLAKISKKVPQDRIPRSPSEENNFQTRINKPIEQRALKEKQKKAELTDVTDQQKKKRKDKEKLIHQAGKRKTKRKDIEVKNT